MSDNSFYMRPPIPPPTGDTLPPAPASPSLLPLLFIAAVAVGLIVTVAGASPIFLWWTSPMERHFPDMETLLALPVGLLLTGLGVLGFAQWKRR